MEKNCVSSPLVTSFPIRAGFKSLRLVLIVTRTPLSVAYYVKEMRMDHKFAESLKA